MTKTRPMPDHVAKPAVVFASGSTLERRAIAKHPAAWYYVEKVNGTEALTWIPDEVAEALIAWGAKS